MTILRLAGHIVPVGKKYCGRIGRHIFDIRSWETATAINYQILKNPLDFRVGVRTSFLDLIFYSEQQHLVQTIRSLFERQHVGVTTCLPYCSTFPTIRDR